LKPSKWILILFGLSGMAALIYEITWIRPLSLVFGTTIYAVSTIIASFIFGLAIGSWIAGKYSDKIKNPLKFFAFIQLGIGFYGIILLPIFSILPGTYLDLYNATFPLQPLFMFLQILISMLLILIPTSLMGATLPLLLKSYSQNFSSIGKDVGKLDASNSFGAMIGTLAAGFLLIPLLGIQNSIVLAASINIGMGIIILVSKRFLNYKHLALVGISIILLFVLTPGYDIMALNFGVYIYNYLDSSSLDELISTQEILFYEESQYSTVLVLSDNGVEKLTLNGKSQCANLPNLVQGLINLGYLPFELFEYNYGKPKTALNIGLGCGVTSNALSQHLYTTTIEIDPAVVEASKFFVDTPGQRLVIDDARNWLIRNDEKFDIITSEPSDPFINRNSMFTKEFFSLQNSRLSENGVVAQWVPIYEMTIDDFYIYFNTFHSVFPYVYAYQMEPDVVNQLIFIGSQKPLQIKENSLFLFNAESLTPRDTILNTDDRPVLEFSIARNTFGIEESQYVLNQFVN